MSSPLLDAFSPEICAIVYGHMFGQGEAITPITWLRKLRSQPEESWDRSAMQLKDEDSSLFECLTETNILTVNKQVYAEAIQVLYGIRIVRGSIARMQDLFTSHNVGFRTHVRHVEITRLSTCLRRRTSGSSLVGRRATLATQHQFVNDVSMVRCWHSTTYQLSCRKSIVALAC